MGRHLLSALVAAMLTAIATADGNTTSGGSTVNGNAGIVPPGYTEVCALRGILPPSMVTNGNAPSPYVILFYGGRQFKSVSQPQTTSPVWQGSGCTTYPTLPPPSDGSALALRVEVWDDRKRAFDPLGMVYKDVMLAAGAIGASGTSEAWIPLNVTDAQLQMAVTVAPASDSPNAAVPAQKFKTLTSTPAFFVYVGSATITIIVCVCCLWGKGAPPPPLAQLPSSSRYSGGEKGKASREHLVTRPSLTIEVSTPPAVRELEVVAIDGEKRAATTAQQSPPSRSDAKWPSTLFKPNGH